jgi:hypothetical protein
MVRVKTWWRSFMNFAVLFSFIFNFIFLIIVIALVMMLFDLKRGLVQPLVNGLHSSFVGLDQSTIIASVKVDDVVPVKLSIPLSANTVVVLTDNVPVRANATFNLPGGGGTINGAVSIVLPTGLKLPVSLNMTVPVDDKLPISLNVPVNIRVRDTQLHDAIDQLRLVLDPYVRLLNNLPNSWNEMWAFAGNLVSGKPVDVFRPNSQSLNPWPGFRSQGQNGTPAPGNATPGLQLTAPAPNSGGSGQPPPSGPQATATRVVDLGIITPTPTR